MACLNFFECVTQKRDSNSLNIDLHENANLEDVKEAISASEYTIEETYYVPRCLCVVSRNRYYQTLKVSLQMLMFFIHFFTFWLYYFSANNNIMPMFSSQNEQINNHNN